MHNIFSLIPYFLIDTILGVDKCPKITNLIQLEVFDKRWTDIQHTLIYKYDITKRQLNNIPLIYVIM
jgi:hypothetical protein